MINIRIDLHDGSHIETQVEAFDTELIASQINDNQLLVVAMGEAIVNRNMIRAIYEVTPA